MKIQIHSLCFTLGLSFPLIAALAMLAGCASNQPNLGNREQMKMNDQSLQLQVATVLSDNPDYKFAGVTITASNGLVRLGGSVDLFAQKVAATDLVMQVPGVKDVEDNIRVKEQSPKGGAGPEQDKSLTTIVKSVLDNNPDYRYEEVNVAVSEGTVQLSGFVNTAEQKKQAGDLARAVPGVKDVSNNITVKVTL